MKEPRLGSKAVSLALRSQRHISEFEASLFTVSTRATKTPISKRGGGPMWLPGHGAVCTSAAHSPKHTQHCVWLAQGLAKLQDSQVSQWVAAHLQLQQRTVFGQHRAEVGTRGSCEATGLYPVGTERLEPVPPSSPSLGGPLRDADGSPTLFPIPPTSVYLHLNLALPSS